MIAKSKPTDLLAESCQIVHNKIQLRRDHIKIVMYNCNNVHPAAIVIRNRTCIYFRGISGWTTALLFVVSFYNTTGCPRKRNAMNLPSWFVHSWIAKKPRSSKQPLEVSLQFFPLSPKVKSDVQTANIHILSASLVCFHFICQGSHFQSHLLPTAIIVFNQEEKNMGR